MDLLGPLRISIMVEREHHCFPVEIDYENLPPKCNHCGLIGHETKNCRQLQSKEVLTKRKEVCHVYKVKNKEADPTVPASGIIDEG